MSKQHKRNKMSGLRLKGGIYHIQKRCKYCQGGWLRESTKTSSRAEAESYLIRRLAEIEEAAQRVKENVYLFEEAGLQYFEDIAHKPSAETMAYHLDLLLPFIGGLPLEQVHDGIESCGTYLA